MSSITLTGNPLTTNNLYAHHGRMRYITSEGKERKTQYQWEAKSQWGQAPLLTPLKVEVGLYFSTKRRHDIDNFTKAAFDSLTGICWKDDSQIYKMTIEKFYDAANPRIEITIL